VPIHRFYDYQRNFLKQVAVRVMNLPHRHLSIYTLEIHNEIKSGVRNVQDSYTEPERTSGQR
jgi:hypothetical protein